MNTLITIKLLAPLIMTCFTVIQPIEYGQYEVALNSVDNLITIDQITFHDSPLSSGSLVVGGEPIVINGVVFTCEAE